MNLRLPTPKGYGKLIRWGLRGTDWKLCQSIISKHEAAEIQRKLQLGFEEIRRCGFWFIDIPRTSSSSIRVELSRQYGPVYGKQNLLELQHACYQLLPDHIPAVSMRQFLGNELWESIFTFTFVRNPWDRMVSLYRYLRKSGLILDKLTFAEYVYLLKEAKGGADVPLFRYYGLHFSCADYIHDDQRNIIVNFIGKFENRKNDIKKVAEKLDYKALGNLAIQNTDISGKHYSTFYDEETMDIVSEIYAEDIHLFDYSFEKYRSINPVS